MECLVLLVNLLLLLGCTESQAFHGEWGDVYRSMHGDPSHDHIFQRQTREAHGSDRSHLQQHFKEAINISVVENQLLLIHTRIQGEDAVTFNGAFNGAEEKLNIKSQTFHNLMVLAHLPVTALSILLPHLQPDNFTASNSFNTALNSFNKSLERLRLDQWFNKSQEDQTGSSIVKKVHEFVKKALDTSVCNVSIDSIKSFTSDIRNDLQKAAEFALRDYFQMLNETYSDYFQMLNMIYSEHQNGSVTVVIAVDGFSYPDSFLFQYYESEEFRLTGLKAERIILLEPSSCDSSTINASTDFELLRSKVSKATFLQTISMLFQNTGPFPLHSVLTEAARTVLDEGQGLSPDEGLTLTGFDSLPQRLYVVLLVVLFSTSAIFCLVTLSVYVEDKRMKMENKPVQIKKVKSPKGPSLLTPFVEREIASSYSAFHQLRKKHLRGKRRDSDEIELLSPEREASKQEAGKHVSLVSEPDNPSLSYSGSTANGTKHEARAVAGHATVKLKDFA